MHHDRVLVLFVGDLETGMRSLIFARFDVKESSGTVQIKFNAPMLKRMATDRFDHRRNILETGHPTLADMLLQQIQRVVVSYDPKSIRLSPTEACLIVHPKADFYALTAELRVAVTTALTAQHPWVILDDPLDPEGWALCIAAHLTKAGVNEVPVNGEDPPSANDNDRLTEIGRSVEKVLRGNGSFHPYVILPDRVYLTTDMPAWLKPEDALDMHIANAIGKHARPLTWEN